MLLVFFIGMRLGKLQAKCGLISMLRTFKYEIDDSQKQCDLEFDRRHFLLQPMNDIYLRVSKRWKHLCRFIHTFQNLHTISVFLSTSTTLHGCFFSFVVKVVYKMFMLCEGKQFKINFKIQIWNLNLVTRHLLVWKIASKSNDIFIYII